MLTVDSRNSIAFRGGTKTVQRKALRMGTDFLGQTLYNRCQALKDASPQSTKPLNLMNPGEINYSEGIRALKNLGRKIKSIFVNK